MDNETLASLLRGRNRAGQPVDATANIIGPAMNALGNTIYGAGRGALTAMAGLPGDINQLITDNLGTLVNAQGLPTTQQIQDFLPAKPTSYEGKLAQKLGEFVPVNPTPIAKGAVAIAKPVGKAMGEQAYRMTEDMLQKQGMMPSIVAYHGTPHNIEGAFDISKVGTGEGAQSYGHGMYYAENPNVAESYAKNIPKSLTGLKIGNTELKYVESPKTAQEQAHNYLIENARTAKIENPNMSAMDVLHNSWGTATNPKIQQVITNLINNNKKASFVEPKGNLYKVDIPDEYVPKMLDYDKPIKDQPELYKLIRDNIKDDDIRGVFERNAKSGISGANAYSNYIGGKTDAERSANALKIGIKGIRYLDEGSRGKEKGTSNFVVFDPKEVKILEKNSKPVSRKEIIEEQVNNLK